MEEKDSDRKVTHWISGVAIVGLVATGFGLIMARHWVGLCLLVLIAGMVAVQVYVYALEETTSGTGHTSPTSLPWSRLMKRYHRIGSVTRFILFVGLGGIISAIVLTIGWAGGQQPIAIDLRSAYNKFWSEQAFGLTPLLLAFLIGIFRLLLENRLGDPVKSSEVHKLLGWALWPKDAVSNEESTAAQKQSLYTPFDLQFKPGQKGAIVWFLSFLALWMVDAGIELVRYFTRGSGNTVDPGAGYFTLEVLALHWLVIGAAWAWIYLGLFRKLCDSHGLSGTLARRYLGLKSNAQLPFQVVVIGASGSGKTSFIVRHPAQEIGLADTGKVRGFSFPGAVRSAQYQVVAIDPPGEFLGDHLYYAQEGRADCLVLVVLAKGLDTEQLRITSQGLASSCGSPITANAAKEVLDKFIACWKRPDDERDPKYLRALRLALTRQEIAGAANRKPPLETAETPDGLSTAPVATQANDPAPDSLLAVNDRPKRFCLFLNLDKDFPKFLEEFPLLEWKNGANIQPEHNGLHRVAEAWGRLFGLQPEACRTISGRVDNAYLFERIYDTDFTAKPASPEALPSANVFQ